MILQQQQHFFGQKFSHLVAFETWRIVTNFAPAHQTKCYLTAKSSLQHSQQKLATFCIDFDLETSYISG